MYSAIGLINTKNRLNYGGVLRAAHCYSASLIALEGRRFRKQVEDVKQAWKTIPVLETDDLLRVVPFCCVPVVVELVEGAQDLRTFTHPARAFYIFGPEDGSVPSRILDKVSTRVMIPTQYCMNLAATVNVILYDRLLKEKQ